jgi:hypothetical protein
VKGSVVERKVQGEDIGAPKQLFHRYAPDPVLPKYAVRQIGSKESSVQENPRR